MRILLNADESKGMSVTMARLYPLDTFRRPFQRAMRKKRKLREMLRNRKRRKKKVTTTKRKRMRTMPRRLMTEPKLMMLTKIPSWPTLVTCYGKALSPGDSSTDSAFRFASPSRRTLVPELFLRNADPPAPRGRF